MKTKSFVLFVAGILFGSGLALSGMTDPARVIGFLDVTGKWDPSLAFVMGGALTVFGLGIGIWRFKKCALGWFGTTLPDLSSGPIDVRLIVGALIFGIGWGVGGFCPGPAIANLGALRIDAVIFLVAMGIGAVFARVGFGAE